MNGRELIKELIEHDTDHIVFFALEDDSGNIIHYRIKDVASFSDSVRNGNYAITTFLLEKFK
jgi:hypothetical protein